MDAIQYGVNYHSNKTSLAKLLHGTVESSFTATPSQLWPPLCSSHPLFLFWRTVLVVDPNFQKRGGWGGGSQKINFFGLWGFSLV